MKKITFIILVLLAVACANDRSNKVLETAESSELEILDNADMEKPKVFTHQNLYTEKLQDYFDLLYVMNEHPEFYEVIKLQLEEIVNDTSLINKTIIKTTIEDVEQIGDIQILSDSVTSIKVRFKKVSKGSVNIDSLKLIMTKKTLTIDDVKTTSSKVMLSNLD